MTVTAMLRFSPSEHSKMQLIGLAQHPNTKKSIICFLKILHSMDQSVWIRMLDKD